MELAIALGNTTEKPACVNLLHELTTCHTASPNIEDKKGTCILSDDENIIIVITDGLEANQYVLENNTLFAGNITIAQRLLNRDKTYNVHLRQHKRHCGNFVISENICDGYFCIEKYNVKEASFNSIMFTFMKTFITQWETRYYPDNNFVIAYNNQYCFSNEC